MEAWPSAVTVGLGHPLVQAAMSRDRLRVAAVVGNRLHIGDGIAGRHTVIVALGPIGAIAWLDNDTLLATVGARGLVAIDAATGAVAREPDFAFDSKGLAVIPPPGL
jgi:hypothetical protein